LIPAVPQARQVFVAILFFRWRGKDALFVVVDAGFTASLDSLRRNSHAPENPLTGLILYPEKTN
jgi:hypothetical protein